MLSFGQIPVLNVICSTIDYKGRYQDIIARLKQCDGIVVIPQSSKSH